MSEQQPVQQQPAPQPPAPQQPAPQQPAPQQPAPQQPAPQQPAPQQPAPQQPQQPEQQPFYKDLPWLRFWCNLIFYLIFMGVLIWGGYCLWENTKPQKEPQAIKELIQAIKEKGQPITIQRHSKEKTKVEQKFKDTSPSYYRNPVWFPSLDSAKTTIETSKAEDVPESYTIQKDDFDNALNAVAMASRQEVLDEYHKSFSILVTILTIFGIGFPIIIALVQHSFNDRDLDKIENTATKADEAVKQVNSIKTEANNATTIALTAANESTEAAKSATQAVNDANNSLKENEKLKNEVLLLSQTLFDEISVLDLLLTVPLKKEKRWFSLRVWLRYHATLNHIKKTEVEIRNNDLEDEIIKERLELENDSINYNVKQLLSLNNDHAEELSLKYLYLHSKGTLNEYKQILTQIKKHLPHELHDVIEKLEKTVQEAIDNITEKEKTLPPEDNN